MKENKKRGERRERERENLQPPTNHANK